MTDEAIVFEVESVLGVTVVLMQDRWNYIRRQKHRDMDGMLAEVQLTVSDPDEVRRSSSNLTAYLYYRVQGARKFVCVVTHTRGPTEARVTTAYATTKIKPGELVWQR